MTDPNPAPSIVSRLIRSFQIPPSPRALGMFYHQLGSTLSAGLPIIRALNSITGHSGPLRIRRRLPAIVRHIEAGGNLSGALQLFPDLFEPMHIAVIKAGEQSGRIETALFSLAAACERRSKLTALCRTGLIYPLLLLNLGFLAFPFVQSLNSTRPFWQLALPPILIFYGAVLLALFVPRFIRQFPAGNLILDSIQHAIPFISGLKENLSFARFSRTFESIYGAGTSIVAALQSAGDAAGDEIVRRRANAAAALVDQGMPLSKALRNIGGFPGFFVEAVETGEEAGELSGMLAKVAERYESDADIALRRLFIIIPITVYLGVLAYMGYRIFQMLYDLVIRPLQDVQNF